MTIRIAEEWLHSCSGCEIALLNIGESLIGLLSDKKIVHMPILMDHKYYGQLGENTQLNIPEADIGLISGGCASEEHKEVLEEMRNKCHTLVALGTCATHGGIPALINSWGMKAAFEETFSTLTTDEAQIPDENLPEPLDRVYALDEIVSIDILLPGCPPNPEHIALLLEKIPEDKDNILPGKSVCDTCPTIRTGKGSTKTIHRCIENAEYNPDQNIDAMRCLLEQGFMCMGPVTAAGCKRDDGPSCIRARVPCRGCFGPVRKKGNQMLDFMNALAGNNIDFKSIVDRKSLLRFAGAHNRLRKLKKKK